ncbi:10196_t:CDS:2 [Ambispora gerdemannii]|uniref:10196_t:CDS:1 n=1 Tax=Ambispora gerdemannii TaxID=144530 RepID=A0A9N9GPY4_9GLOM|nr:10196_t:CDS:2 [Ambispora gerdemannii]
MDSTQNGGKFATNTTPTPTPTYANLHAPPNWPSTRPYNGVKDLTFHIVFTFIYIFFSLSLIGSIYVIYRTYMKWKSNNYETLPMSLRLPFYSVIVDCLIIIAHLVNTVNIQGYSVIYAVPWFSPVCEVIGALSIWTLSLNLHLFFTVAISTYLRVCRKIRFDYGKCDYKLFIIVVALATLPLLTVINGYGAGRWWCAGKKNANTLEMIGIMSMTMEVVIVIFAHYRIIILLVRHRSQLRERLDSRTFNDFEHRIARNVARYILLFFLQWLPISVFVAVHRNGNEEAWTYIILIIGLSFSGIANSIQYIVNEGFSHKIALTSSSNNSNSLEVITIKN